MNTNRTMKENRQSAMNSNSDSPKMVVSLLAGVVGETSSVNKGIVVIISAVVVGMVLVVVNNVVVDGLLVVVGIVVVGGLLVVVGTVVVGVVL